METWHETSCSVQEGQRLMILLITEISLSHLGSRLSFCRLILAAISLCSESITFILSFLFSCLLWDAFRTKDHYHIIFLLLHSPPSFRQDPRPVTPVTTSTWHPSSCRCRLWDVEETYPEVREKHFFAEDLWIRLLVMNKDPEHFRADRKSSHNKCAWKVVMHALHKWEQDVQPSYIRALLPSTAPLRWIKSPSGNCTWFSQDPSSANNVHTQGKKIPYQYTKKFCGKHQYTFS